MSYTPLAIQIRDALYAQVRERMSVELVAVGQIALPDTAFSPVHPELVTGETVGIMYSHTTRERQAQYWLETSFHFELQLVAIGTSLLDMQTRIMYLEYAALQALYHDRTLGDVLKTLKADDSSPLPVAQGQGLLMDGLIIPVVCQPAMRQALPERDES